MAIFERRNDRPAASGPQRQRRMAGWAILLPREECRRLAAGEEDRERAIAGKGRRAQRAYCGAWSPRKRPVWTWA